MSPRGKASRSFKRPPWLSALGRFLSGGLKGEGPSSEPESVKEEAELEAEANPEEVPEGDRIVDCPRCGAPAAIIDEGTTHSGVGFCGHEYLFKMLKLLCARGHNLTLLDEHRSVHEPGVECKELEASG